ncbi:DUF2637 domain-containing protein [Streptomyces halstedii]|uniref:DUF2637 domain-containing protein n=1 Tax=Streptomyces halstedii TaxID=1944 RepID=A0ABS6U0V3_STRHA|nr:DUF2637 domain-containing protein [Streptomyces halstedii]MBV7674145.1 DUF2637 domain-containing protein [Streptomyces halstedii]
MQLTRTHKVLIGVVVAGAVLIAAIGFAGSYAAVRELALEKGFGDFSLVFPIGIDAGICVLLALDLLLTWMRIPFPLLRQTAWLLTAATIAFNGAAAWPDPLGTGMHAVIPVLFVVSVEAARHAVGRIADITADKHMEGVRLTRWLLSPVPTFKLWRRMKLWELRSYEQVIKLEQDRLVYQARLQARFGRNWRRKAPIESMMPLRLAKYGVPLADTAPAGLAAAGIEPALLPPTPAPEPAAVETEARQPQLPYVPQQAEQPGQQAQQANLPQEGPGSHHSPWFAAPQFPSDAANPSERAYAPTFVEGLDPAPVRVPAGPGGRTRLLGTVGAMPGLPAEHGAVLVEGDPVGQDAADSEVADVIQKRTDDLVAAAPGDGEHQEAADPAQKNTGTGSGTELTATPHDPMKPGQAATVPEAEARSAEVPGDWLAEAQDAIGRPHPYRHEDLGGVEPRPVFKPSMRRGLATSPASAADEPNVRQPGGGTAVAPMSEPSSHGGVPEQSPDLPVARPESVGSEATVQEAVVADSGTATARLPEQHEHAPELDPVQQQIVTVTDWLIEAEEAGKKLSGAEVARRLSVSARTGQRRLDKATEHLAEQRRLDSRAHLRSVRS